MSVKIYYCLMEFNRLDELKQLKTIHQLMPYVDQTIIVDGSCGKDGTEEWLYKEFPSPIPITVIHSAWTDDFPGQRTQYLNMVGTLRKPDEDSWVIVNDSDEVFSPLLAKNIREIINKAKDTNDMILIRCKSVTVDNDGNTIYENLDDGGKSLVFKYYNGMKYWADRSNVTKGKTALHEALQVNGEFVWKPIQLGDKDGRLIYEHVKLEGTVWERGCRNFIVFGGGPNLGDKQPLWKPFRDLLNDAMKTDQYTSYDVLEYFKRGNIDQRIKDWMIQYKDEDGYDGASEVRECYLTYFKLYHPEEIPEEHGVFYITYCMMGMNCIRESSKRFTEMSSYVDNMIYVDGGSIDDTIIYMRNRDDVKTYIHPWKDGYAEQRNNYLLHATKEVSTDWIIVSDHDEYFSEDLLKDLRDVIMEADSAGFNKIDIQCTLVYMKADKEISSELRQFWKPLIFKNEPGIYYEGSPHETIHNPKGWKEQRIGGKYTYFHVRQENVIWIKGARNFVVSGGAMLYDKNPHYVSFKEALRKDGHNLNSVEFNKLMVDGKVGENTVKWIIDHKDINDASLPKDCLSEMGEVYKTYFRLYHPEEIPAD